MRWVVESTERGGGDLPTFPAVAMRLVDLLEQPNANLREVEALVAQDPAIAAELLRTANSALYAGPAPVESVAQATLRLGFRETSQVAMTAACRALFDLENRAEVETYPHLWRALWHDALVCAYGGRLLARELKRGSSERVFLGAMFRNVGGLIVLKTVARALVRGQLRERPADATLGAVMHALTGRLGARYLRGCRLPDHVVAAAARHREAGVPFTPDMVDLHLVRLADGLCHAVGVPPFAAGALGPLAEESAAAFDLAPERLEYFTLQFQELAAQLQSLV
jgi:HD-like signal output (HDOD) protein